MLRTSIVIVPGILLLMSGAALGDLAVVPADEPSWMDTGLYIGTDEGVTIGGELFYPAVYLSTKNSVGLGGSIYIFYNL